MRGFFEYFIFPVYQFIYFPKELPTVFSNHIRCRELLLLESQHEFETFQFSIYMIKFCFFNKKKKLKLLMEISKGGPGLDYQSLD